jgi:hypothetical protein
MSLMKTSRDFFPFLAGGGRVDHPAEGSWRLELPPMPTGYGDAQIDDTQSLPRKSFLWEPPLRLTLRARAQPSAPLGTLGFGFWNDPFAVSLGQGGAARRLPDSPQAMWYFYGSPPNDLAFSEGARGEGWKAMCLVGPPLPALLLAPGAAAAFLASRLPLLRGPVVRAAKSRIRAAEGSLSATLADWHHYSLEWHPCEARFEVDGDLVLTTEVVPRPPLGFVAWIDNQFATASPRSGFSFGTLTTGAPQILEISDLRIERL